MELPWTLGQSCLPPTLFCGFADTSPLCPVKAGQDPPLHHSGAQSPASSCLQHLPDFQHLWKRSQDLELGLAPALSCLFPRCANSFFSCTQLIPHSGAFPETSPYMISQLMFCVLKKSSLIIPFGRCQGGNLFPVPCGQGLL